MVFKAYRQTSAYGWRTHPIHKTRKFHAGIDLVKLKGGVNAPIEAFIGGEVIYAGFGQSGTGVGGYGNVVVIKDSKGAAHVYAHLHSVSVKKGATVKKGQTIGRQGATGNVTGAHLHYEVRKKSSPSLGWTSKQEKSTHNPTTYVKNYGGANLKVDGLLGPLTIKALQRYFDTVVDGVISKPSMVIRALQRHLNANGAKLKVDGLFGPLTIRALQKYLGTVQDGKISKPSLVIKELQRRLNAGNL